MARVINGRYGIKDDPIGAGGIADVYAAVDLEADLPRVAVKIIRPRSDHKGLLQVFFQREVEALRALRNRNIVQLLDAGVDHDTKEFFLVLEWMPSDLIQHLSAAPPEGWDDFADAIAMPLLEGLAHAHDRGVVHRDVKPGNVLVSDRGEPKLADFGISKIKSQLGGSPETVAEFMSRPYAPPEMASTSSYTRDVFGFGVLVLACLVDVPLSDYPDIQVALSGLDAPREVIGVLERAVSFEPQLRQPNGLVLLSEIEDIQRRRRQRWRTTPTINLLLTHNAINKFSSALDAAGAEEISDAIEEDLASGVYLERMLDRSLSPPRLSAVDIWLYGEIWRYHARPDEQGSPTLAIVGATPLDPGRIDAAREFAWLAPFRFRLGPPLNHETARDALRSLDEQLDEFHERRDEERKKRESDRLFNQWRSQLVAKQAVETSRESPLAFVSATLQGRRATFRLTDIPDGNLLGERRGVQGKDGQPSWIRGEVEDVRGDQLILYLDRAEASLPSRGDLVLDTSETRAAIDRQKQALDAVRFGSAGAVRGDLRELILNPGLSALPTFSPVEKWFQDGLDDDKRRAVGLCLGAPDFFVVEGPPGTGKTSLIVELAAQELARNPQARILLTSQTHVALDNALERLRSLLADARLVRLGRASSVHIAPSVQDLLLDTQVRDWASSVRRRSEKFLAGWAKRSGISLDIVRRVLSLGELIAAKRDRAAVRSAAADVESRIQKTAERGVDTNERLTEEELEDLREQLADHRARGADLRRQIDTMIDSLAKPLGRSKQDLLQLEPEALADLAATLIPAETTGDVVGLQFLLQLQGEWLERVGRGSEFEGALIYASQVVAGTAIGLAGVRAMRDVPFDLCIFDEASKATATETLVPLVRAKRWILVGDPKQLPPFQEEALNNRAILEAHQLDEGELGRTLFDRLLEGLPSECRFLLSSQHRMAKPIGDMISQCFYQGRLKSATALSSRDLEAVLPSPMTWLTTHVLPEGVRRERPAGLGATSFANPSEAGAIIQFLERLNWYADHGHWEARHAGKKLSVLVLSGYRPQVASVEQRITSSTQNLTALQVEVNTVDAAQGREADLAIFSVTRSNTQGRLGFLAFAPRLNVALSRGRYGLVIVGDLAFCQAHGGPLADVASYIQSADTGCQIVEVEP